MKKLFVSILLIFAYTLLFAQLQYQPNPSLSQKIWDAKWISHPSASLKDYGVFHFRRTFDLKAKPTSFIINISADTRYKLFVNGKHVGIGPAKSDLSHWNFDTYDISAFLKTGKNVIAAVVWNFGEFNGYSQHSNKTAFILQGNSENEKFLNTDKKWSVMQNKSYEPIVFAPSDKRILWQYYVAGALDSLNASKYPWDWQEININDNNWLKAREFNYGCPQGITNPEKWTLVPRNIPYLEYNLQRFAKVRKISGAEADPFFLAQNTFWLIPARSKVSILIDNETNITAYPEMIISGGQGSKIKISYAEALWDDEGVKKYKVVKGNRNSIEGNTLYGVYDFYIADGGESRKFQPLWMRTFRYVKIDIEVGDNPLTLRDFYYYFTAYPLQQKSSFKTNDETINKIWDASWRTIRLCSQENQIDPYFEQMQYIGDTRLQSLSTLFSSGDDRLVRNSLEQFNNSRSPEGLTMSRYPSDLPQYSPMFSLCWTLMVNDYWMNREDDKFISNFTPGIIGVLEWFEKHVNEEKMIGSLPYLDFLDTFYSKENILKQTKSQSLAPITLFYVYTIQQIAPLLKKFGKSNEADHFLKLAAEIKKSTIDKCYDPTKKLFSENSDKKVYSQHANIMAVLADCLTLEDQKAIMLKTIKDTSSMIQPTTYFKFYMFQAMKKAGIGNEYVNQLGDWKYMLNNGMTTFGEWKINPRSECHSWSASPSYDFLSTICGIEPASPGFKAVKIEPNIGNLKNVEGTFYHPRGNIVVKYIVNDQKQMIAEVNIPPAITGNFVWKGKVYPLKTGRSSFTLLF